MQREIKFRAQREDKNQWVYSMTLANGHTKMKSYEYFMEIGPEQWVRVQKETIGQFTGLHDKNGKEIYEGDVVNDYVIDVNFEVVYTDYANFGLKSNKRHFKSNEYEVIDSSYASTTLEIIGNIYENPELLKEKV